MTKDNQENIIKENGGYSFTEWGIHVAAKTIEEAKAIIKEYHGKDVDNDTPPLISKDEKVDDDGRGD